MPFRLLAPNEVVMQAFDSQRETKLTKTELLKVEQNNTDAGTIVGNFGRAFVQSAAIDPVWNGLGQLVSAENLPLVSIVDHANVRQNDGNAWAQKLGSAVGIAADFVLLSKGKRAIFGGASTEALAAMPWQERAVKSAYEGTKLGAFYGAVLTPSDPKENLVWGRIANAGSQAISFGLLNFGTEFIGAAKMFKNINPQSSAAVIKDMGVSGLAGIPAGIAAAVTDAKFHGKELRVADVGNSAIDYAVIGFTMAGLNHGVRALSTPDSHGVTTARRITDGMGVTRAPEGLGKQAEFRIVDGKAEFEGFYNKRLNSNSPAEAVVKVQQKLHGAFSGIFGDRFASYGETRPMLLKHGRDIALSPAMASTVGLIATCEPLPLQFRGKDVFPDRAASTTSDTNVWLQPRGENRFQLSRGEKPVALENAPEPVMLGLPRMEFIDATKIKAGESLDTNSRITLTRDAEGKLWAEAKSDSQGIWVRMPLGVERKFTPGEQIYSSDVLVDISSLAATIKSGTFRAQGLDITKRGDDIYVRDAGQGQRFYVKADPGTRVEIAPNAKFIHLGPDGIVPIANHLVTVPKPPVERPKVDPAPFEHPAVQGTDAVVADAPAVIDPLIPAGALTKIDLMAKVEPPKPAKEKPVVSAPVEDLGTLASRLTGSTIDPKDPAWRFGKFGDVVLDTAKGGVDAGDGTIRIVFPDFDSALSAGRFTTGIFKRRLQTDPQDKSTAPSMKVTVDEFQDTSGASLFVPVLDIRGIGAGRLVLGDNLRPLGIQNATDLILIDKK